MGLGDIFRNIKNRGLEDITSPEKIKNYFDGSQIKKEGIHLDYDEILPYAEQLVYRSIQCGSCFADGKCFDCQCPQPLAAMVVDHQCSTGRYGHMLNAEEWNKFKQDKGISFKL